jgi:putative spermidine/putrescine transport system permease protein
VRLRRWTGPALVAPVVLLILACVALPILSLLVRAVDDRDVARTLPATLAALADWPGDAAPPDAAFAALVADLARAGDGLGELSRRLNHERPGMRRALLAAARLDPGLPPGELRRALAAARPEWEDPAVWRLLRRFSAPLTPVFLLNAVDLTLDEDGRVARVPADQALFRDVFQRTIEVSALVTGLALVMGYPIAWLLATSRGWVAGVAMAAVLVAFWTALLVRTTAWFVLLQSQGPINGLILWLGLADQPTQLIFTRVAVVATMLHNILPLVVLPIWAVLRNSDPRLGQAAMSLGAPPVATFLRVTLPLSMPAVAAAGLTAFVTCLGFYVTPALVGGDRDQLVGYFIAFFTNRTINLPMASALATITLVGTAVLLILCWVLLPGLRAVGQGQAVRR